MATILITGGAGFIGSHVARELISLGHKVVLLDAFVQYVSPLEGFYREFLNARLSGIEDKIILERGDTRDKLNLLSIIYKYRPERIINLSALPIADLSNRYPDESVSTIVNSTVNLLDIIKGVDFVKRFVHISSSMIYGDFEYLPADEEHPTNPKDVYGGTKLASEILVRAYNKRFGLEYAIVRPSAVYGPTDVNNRVSQMFVFNAFKGKPLILHNGGAAKLDFTFVEDIAHGICLAAFAEKGANETFNITRGEGRSLREYADMLLEHFPDLKVESKSLETFRPKRGALDIAKARELLGYEPKWALEDGLERYIEFLRPYLGDERLNRSRVSQTARGQTA